LPKYRVTTEDFEDYSDFSLERSASTRPPEARHVPKKARSAVLNEIVEATGLEGGFNPTFQPAKYEKVWLLASLKVFYEQHLISDVLAQVKGGKEATVYRCQAYPETGLDLVAAKVYRPRQFRNLRNDKMYREGRQILTGEGRAAKRTDSRIMRAIGKKTAFGEQVQHTSWLLYEYTTLEKLYQAGAAVPQPHAVSDNVIVMEYRGDYTSAAPTLHETVLPQRQARAFFEEVLRNIELMLQHGLVHGDLSAYNILYWDNQLTLIDFPQVTDIHSNPNARFILERDLKRICEYFDRYAVRSDWYALANEFWAKYGEPDLEEDLLAELSE
jgi:RIO kinase 1